jgi:hypothetical protein
MSSPKTTSTNKQSYWFEIHAYFRNTSHTHEVRATSLKAAKALIENQYLGKSVRIKYMKDKVG